VPPAGTRAPGRCKRWTRAAVAVVIALLPAADYWRLGAIFGVIFIAALLAIGLPWMAIIK